jgi:hypothetical protein
MNEPEQPKKGWGWLVWGAVVVVLLLMSLFAHAVWIVISDTARMSSASNSCRQIIMSLKIWAEDNDGAFPDATFPCPHSSNQVLRKLFQEEIIQDERVFGGIGSPFMSDNNFGEAHHFSHALEPGENHWAMVAGLNPRSEGSLPLVFENAINSEWPPKWLINQITPVRGRTWRGGRIIVGRVDNSVNVEKLVERNGVLTLPDTILKPGGKPLMPLPQVLGIEEKANE